MSELLAEHNVLCPTCWESTTLALDLSVDNQSFIEDCEVCCSPMKITVAASGGELLAVEAEIP